MLVRNYLSIEMLETEAIHDGTDGEMQLLVWAVR